MDTEDRTIRKGEEEEIEAPAAPVEDPKPRARRSTANQKGNGAPAPEDAEAQRKAIEADLNRIDPDSDPDPLTEPKRYCIGKPPDMGGEDNEYSYYTQRSMGYIQMLRWTGLVSKSVAEAIKAGGAVDLGDAFNSSSGTVQDRAKQIIENSFNDAGSFAALLFQLIAYSPDLILETYCYALDVPNGSERTWAKRVMEQRWDPELGHWGMQREDGQEILERFIDQNYEELRGFIEGLVRGIVARVRANEKRRVSNSAQSK